MQASNRYPRCLLTVLVLLLALAPPAVATSAETRSTDDRAASGSEAGRTVDLNTATEEQLRELPGVGPAIARRIVESREKDGPFERVEDLMRVKGIGEKTFLKLKPRLRVGKRAG